MTQLENMKTINNAASKFASFVDKNFANPEENKNLDPNAWFPHSSADELLKELLDFFRSHPELLKELSSGGAKLFTNKLKEWLGVHDPKTLLKILLLMNFYLSGCELAPYQVIGVLSLPLVVELNNLVSAENKTEEENVKV